MLPAPNNWLRPFKKAADGSAAPGDPEATLRPKRRRPARHLPGVRLRRAFANLIGRALSPLAGRPGAAKGAMKQTDPRRDKRASLRVDAGQVVAATGLAPAGPEPDPASLVARSNHHRPDPLQFVADGRKLAPEVARRRPKPPRRSKSRSAIPTWPLAKQSVADNCSHFGDCEDIASAHLAGRLFTGREPDLRTDLVSSHRRPFAQPFERPRTGWLYGPAEPASLKAKFFVATGFRRRSYDDQEGDNDVSIILQPSEIEKEANCYSNNNYGRTTTAVELKHLARVHLNNSRLQVRPTSKPLHLTTRTGNRLTESDLLKGNELNLAKSLLDQDYNLTVKLFIRNSALNWNFNSFTFDALCCGRSLTELLLHLFEYYDLYNIFNLDMINVLKCFRLLEFGYHSTNPYHNSIHAADVAQAMHCFMQENKIRNHMTHLEIMCSILAAVCHDLDHPGVTQTFLAATNNPLAHLYNNDSVLENHHWRFALCIFKESKLFDHLSDDIFRDMKTQFKHLILATDIARQNEYLKRFKDLTSSGEFSMQNSQDRALVLQMALKCADLGNPCRPWLISRVWSNLICDEFYRMGQIERKLGIPLTPICQREKTSIAGIQADFFRFIVLPLLELWNKFLQSPLSSLLMSNFNHNYQRWQRAHRIVQQLRRRKSVACVEYNNKCN